MTEVPPKKRHACVIVLGDIGRSPRMQYHAQSLLEDNYHVDVIGYLETRPLETLTQHPCCKIQELTPVPVTNLTPKLRLLFKAFWQTLSLLIALISIRRPSFLLVQNPPGIPTLIVCYLYCTLTRTKFVIDWHNYTYTVLALGMSGGENSFLIRLVRRLERYFGSKAHTHFCVTRAMKDDLQENWKIGPVTVLYDRAPTQFHPIDLVQKHELFLKLANDYPQFQSKDSSQSDVLEATSITQKLTNGTVQYKPQRPAILVSSTSWTPDEDFGILLKALQAYEETAVAEPLVYPQLLCIITGKGPQKEHYAEEIARLKWQMVSVITPWLEIEDYPSVLASADLGVCLHWSTSGLDLPMKVVDMFGSGLPVCAYDFKCLNELVKHGENGFVFGDHIQLAEQLRIWFEHFPKNPSILETRTGFQRSLQQFQELRWRESWSHTVAPILEAFL
ncbi:chitobiosyldiphosphodolichol beta-mannosyltransferase [Drosophila bipectinata]|uniref:chitobiosyldiphosphodolichol beta-mannosyltransferase n=1 Tax=Drosophila bipectinata TaxID=42026 RepID=UPI001C890A91|nr:chitobiosyldiphosphodolichol beta-mannosyltransferase [Drosophila bipectinata]